MLGTGDIMELNVIGFVAAVVASIVLLAVVSGASSRSSA